MKPTFAVITLLLIAACGQSQSALCKQYVACQQEYDQESQTGPIAVDQYEPDGLCWQSGDNAAICDKQCGEGITELHDAAAAANLQTPSCVPTS